MEINFDEFKKLEMRVGKVLEVERVPKTDKLYKLQVDIGERKVQIVTGLVPYYKENELKGKKIIVLVNLKPAKFAGEESNGMLLCAEKKDNEECVLLTTEKDIAVGALIS